jgi:hypothetical protein
MPAVPEIQDLLARIGSRLRRRLGSCPGAVLIRSGAASGFARLDFGDHPREIAVEIVGTRTLPGLCHVFLRGYADGLCRTGFLPGGAPYGYDAGLDGWRSDALAVLLAFVAREVMVVQAERDRARKLFGSLDAIASEPTDPVTAVVARHERSRVVASWALLERASETLAGKRRRPTWEKVDRVARTAALARAGFVDMQAGWMRAPDGTLVSTDPSSPDFGWRRMWADHERLTRMVAGWHRRFMDYPGLEGAHAPWESAAAASAAAV